MHAAFFFKCSDSKTDLLAVGDCYCGICFYFEMSMSTNFRNVCSVLFVNECIISVVQRFSNRDNKIGGIGYLEHFSHYLRVTIRKELQS